MPVFISHRTADDDIAKYVARRLQYVHQIECYVDDFDKEAASYRGTKKITELILQRLRACTNLLAIVTKNTEGSWWVPFEIGVARQAPRVITTFTNLYTLPEYLQEWPVLRGDRAVDEFAALYRGQMAVLKEHVVRKSVREEDQYAAVDRFHTRLKSVLGQS